MKMRKCVGLLRVKRVVLFATTCFCYVLPHSTHTHTHTCSGPPRHALEGQPLRWCFPRQGHRPRESVSCRECLESVCNVVMLLVICEEVGHPRRLSLTQTHVTIHLSPSSNSGVESKQPNSAVRKCVRVQLIKNSEFGERCVFVCVCVCCVLCVCVMVCVVCLCVAVGFYFDFLTSAVTQPLLLIFQLTPCLFTFFFLFTGKKVTAFVPMDGCLNLIDENDEVSECGENKGCRCRCVVVFRSISEFGLVQFINQSDLFHSSYSFS